MHTTEHCLTFSRKVNSSRRLDKQSHSLITACQMGLTQFVRTQGSPSCSFLLIFTVLRVKQGSGQSQGVTVKGERCCSSAGLAEQPGERHSQAFTQQAPLIVQRGFCLLASSSNSPHWKMTTKPKFNCIVKNISYLLQAKGAGMYIILTGIIQYNRMRSVCILLL